MKLKNTLGFAIGSVVAAASFGVMAQGQGAVEGEAFYQKNYNDSVKHVEDGRTAGASIGYFLTDSFSITAHLGATTPRATDRRHTDASRSR